MADSLFTRDGYRKLLNCPVCGEPCASIPPFKSTAQYPFPHWEEGLDGVCQCGAMLVVESDGERAWLVVASV